jgi:hypothetical protein
MRLPGPVARAGQLCAGDQLSCRVAECGGALGEVDGHGDGLDVGEGLGLAWPIRDLSWKDTVWSG